ncbi:MAG: hypothetical protein ABSH56_07805 [Bryobacteraceae bacterium]|jgi:hypothetical protein
MEQRLKGEYALTRVTNKGVVIGLGDILVVKQAGIVGMPASCHGYFANSFTKGARIQPGGARLLEVGDKVYLTNIEVKDTQVVFSVQSCRACDPSSNDRSDSPLRASLAFQFPKEYLATADFKDIQGAIGEVFAVDKPAFERLSKQTGDRNYVDIRLGWTKKPVRFGDITLKLVAIDIKKNTYTVDLIVDDKLIQKKDKRVNEAVEFYAVKGGHIPYVMMIVALNENPREIVGYLATPKAGAAR